MTMKSNVHNANLQRHNMLQKIYNDNYQMRRNYTAQKEVKEHNIRSLSQIESQAVASLNRTKQQ